MEFVNSDSENMFNDYSPEMTYFLWLQILGPYHQTIQSCLDMRM